MKKKYVDKSYIYERDGKKCVFCGKNLKFKQMSIDHYFPKSRGGTNDVFNLVLSCKRCNTLKSSRIPNGYKKKLTKLFLKAVDDEKISASVSRMPKKRVKDIALGMKRIEHMGEYYAFQNDSYRIYVKDDQIYKIIQLSANEKDKYREGFTMRKSFGKKTISYPAPVYIVCSYDENGKANAMNAAWGGLCSSSPASICVSIRKERKTYDNIIKNNAFTINIPSSANAQAADYFGMVSGKDEDKFEKAALTPVKSDVVNAPYIDEFPVAIECSLLKTVEIGSHIQFIGEIQDVKISMDCLDENGDVDIRKVDPILFAPEIRKYYSVGEEVGNAFSIGKSIKDR